MPHQHCWDSLKPSKAIKFSGSSNGGEVLSGHRQLSKEEPATLRRWLFVLQDE
jgi:hypothetical protein